MEESTDVEYRDLLLKLEKANQTLAYYKSNKEISLRDLHKLEMENSALAEENLFLKSRIRNIEKNTSGLGRSNEGLERSFGSLTGSCFARGMNELELKKESDRITVTSAEYFPSRSLAKTTSPVSTNRKSLNMKERAILSFALAYNI